MKQQQIKLFQGSDYQKVQDTVNSFLSQFEDSDAIKIFYHSYDTVHRIMVVYKQNRDESES